MGTHSYSNPCPKCNAQMNCWTETHNGFVGGECLNCGYTYWTEESIKPLKELNEVRNDNDLKPLTKKQYEAKK